MSDLLRVAPWRLAALGLPAWEPAALNRHATQGFASAHPQHIYHRIIK